MLLYCMFLPVFAMFFLDNCPKSSYFAEKIEEWHRRIFLYRSLYNSIRQNCTIRRFFNFQFSLFIFHYLSLSIPPRDVRRVSIGYRLDIDWRKVEPTEINHRIATNDKPKLDPIQTAREGQRAVCAGSNGEVPKGEDRTTLTTRRK